MKYFKLFQNNWIETTYNQYARHIILYDLINGVMTPIGIGQY